MTSKQHQNSNQANSEAHGRRVYRLNQQAVVNELDNVAIESPLQINLSWYPLGSDVMMGKNLSITMRTPGQDKALVIGLLLSQGVIEQLDDIEHMDDSDENCLEIFLVKGKLVDWPSLERTFVSQSSCGICGQSQLKALSLKYQEFAQPSTAWLSIAEICQLPTLLNQQQLLFNQTGGSHSAAIWHAGKIKWFAEDVGRHNAVDKVVGEMWQNQQLISAKAFDTNKAVLILSGRISFELVQKAVCASIATIVAVGAPSSLAIATAKQFNITLVGFVKAQQCNVYHGDARLLVSK